MKMTFKQRVGRTKSTVASAAAASFLGLLVCVGQDAVNPHSGSAQSAVNTKAHPEVKWTLPKDWTEVAPGEMRRASFRVKGGNGNEADVSVMVLPGNAGGDLNNVNRWRGQVGLAAITDEAVAGLSEKV